MGSSSISALLKSDKTSKGDERYTPACAIEPLIPYLKREHVIYEPTSGKSNNIVNFLNDKGFKVISSDNTDFLRDSLPQFDMIVTNPPYSKKDVFLEKCYEIGKPFALLLPVSALQGKKRGKMFSKYGVELLVLNNRVDFTGEKSPHFGVAWFCYNILPQKLIFIDNRS